jgi:hypothetical protein
MTAISLPVLAQAVRSFERLSFDERTQLADEVQARQPNLFLSVLALEGFGASLAQMEMVLNLLLVFYGAMKISGKVWPIISEDIQDRGFKRIGARARPGKAMTPLRQQQAAARAIDEHPEKPMLAYAVSQLSEHGLQAVETETQQMITLVALNLVESIALTAPTTKVRAR